MAGLDIVLRDKQGKIKQDLHIHRDPIEGKVVEENTLKAEEDAQGGQDE